MAKARELLGAPAPSYLNFVGKIRIFVGSLLDGLYTPIEKVLATPLPLGQLPPRASTT